MMGATAGDNGADANEFPAHQVTLTNAFYLGRYEVTQAQWQAAMGSNPSHFQGYSDSPSCPVEQVSWDTIQSFNGATGLRFPTEAEWEFACRAGTTASNYGGDTAWYWTGEYLRPHPGGLKEPNALGFYDTLGNIAEWTIDGFYAYSAGSVTNPVGPNAFRHPVRGGYWSGGGILSRTSARLSRDADYTFDGYGFRAARNP